MNFVNRNHELTDLESLWGRRGLYHLRDNYLNFYFRFVAPFREDLEQGYQERAWKAIEQQLSSYVGLIGFEELCRQWVRERGRQGYLPCYLEQVGSYWDRKTQVDVVGMNWREQMGCLVRQNGPPVPWVFKH